MPGGQFIHGKLQGNGHISFSNGDKYQGAFKDGFRSGFGTMEYRNLSCYERGGDGVQMQEGKDHATYSGMWSHDKRHGAGSMTWADGSRYEGEWRFDMRFNGTMFMIDNCAYTGEFKNDVYCGFGKLRMIDGTVFSGIFVEGKCPKIGRVVTEDGDLYEGEVEDFKPEGVGRMVHVNKNVYDGKWS